MNKTILSGLIGVVVGGTFVFLITARGGNQTQPVSEETQNPQSSTQPAASEEVISIDTAKKIEEKTVEIQYTSSGFNPKAIRVTPGTVVTFKNQTNQKMWVASDPHPNHTDYPKLNQDQIGMMYSHEFEKVGTYNFHNHQQPAHQGTIFVE